MINFDINPYVEEQDNIDFELEPLNEDMKDKIDDVVQDVQDTWDSMRGDGDLGTSAANLTKSTRDVVDTINQGLDPYTVNNPSVIRRASKSTMQFPVYISQNIPITIAQILTNMIERTYATFVTQAFASNKVISADQANDFKFMKSYHSNIREAVEFIDSDGYKNLLINEYYEPIDDFDRMMLESLAYDVKINKNITMSVRAVPCGESTLCMESRRLASDACEGLKVITEDKLEGYTKVVTNTNKGEAEHHDLSFDELRKMTVDTLDSNNLPANIKSQPEASIYYSVPFPKGNIAEQNRYLDSYYKSLAVAPDNKAGWMNQERKNWENISNAVDQYTRNAMTTLRNGQGGPLSGKGIAYDPNSNQFYRVRFKETRTASDQMLRKPDDRVATQVPAPEILKSNEIRKLNQMDPWVIQVSFRVKAEDGSLDSIIPYLISVKAVMHLIRAEDLNDDLYNIVTGTNKSLQKVRYKTGEISFMDYMFNASQLKKDAMKNIDYNRRWVNNLKRLAELSHTSGSSFKQIVELLNKGDVPIPNATLVMTGEDVQSLKDTTGVDIAKLSVARTLIKNLFLISIVVVDIHMDTLRILYDNNADWEVQSMSTIKADNARAMNSDAMKEIEKAMNKMVNR